MVTNWAVCPYSIRGTLSNILIKLHPRAKRLSQHFKLQKTQAELDFVDVFLTGDLPLFIDPYALSKRTDIWSVEASNLAVDFFQQAVDHIRKGDHHKAKAILNRLGEPNDTGLGLSRKKRQGKGVSGKQSLELYDYLKDSTAAKTGFLKDLEDCELLVPGISRDKISDITTNIIREKLVGYTQDQCELLDIPLQSVPCGPFWDPHSHEWSPDSYAELPTYKDGRLLLVPKAIVRYDLAYDHRDYYNGHVLSFLREQHLSAGDSLVQLLRNGKRRVTKKDLKEKYPLSKEFLYKFSKEHPAIFAKYKNELRDLREISNDSLAALTDEAKTDLAAFEEKLAAIPAGTKHAGEYHDCIAGILEAILYPWLTHPKKEQPLHDGRKRIDIVYSNAASSGFFHSLHAIKKVPCPFIMVECKNYSADPSNPELDQLAGRFSPNRGRFGLLVCRTCDDRDLFRKRCRDTAQDDRGWIVMLTDDDIRQLLDLRADGKEQEMSALLENEYKRLVF